jgi:hypothetical protein
MRYYMSNIFSEEDEGEFRDIPDEVTEGQQAPPVNVRVNRPAAPPQAPVQQAAPEPVYEEVVEESEEEDFSSVLTDARFRLEQGRLYEMIMNHNIFEGADADEKAIKYVTKQIRNFAKEQMEIMLGMRQEAPKVEPLAAADFPFNDLEVQTLKALASAATKGATAAPEAQQFSGAQTAVTPRRTGLNPIAVKTPQRQSAPAPKAPAKPLAQKPATPVKRDQRTEAQIEQILAEEGISRAEYERQYNPNYKPLTKPFHEMSEAEQKEWKRQEALKTNKQVKNPAAIPMPTAEQEEMLHTQRAQAAASHPQMQSIMTLLLNQKKT